MKKPGHDVFLNDGCGYVVKSAPYMQHLQESTEATQVSIASGAKQLAVLLTSIL